MAKADARTEPHLAASHVAVNEGDFEDRPYAKAVNAEAFPEALYPDLYVKGKLTVTRPAPTATEIREDEDNA